MPSCATVGCVSRSGKNTPLSFHQIPSYKRKEIKQEWFRHIKRGQNEKYLPKDSTVCICSEHFEKGCFESSPSKFYQLLKHICKNIHRNKSC